MKLSNSIYYLKGYLDSKKLTGPPVIIGGCERSGTSLLQSIISAHPDIFAIDNETWAFCYGPVVGFKSDKPIKISRFYKALGAMNSSKNCSVWSEKSPANIFYFDSTIEYFSGNVRLIHIVRDGRDVVTSMHPGNSRKPWVSIDRWLNVMEKGYQFKDCPQVLTIRYEDLITDFKKTVELICAHIGVDVNDQILNWHQNATIKLNKNLIGETVEKLSSKSIRKFESKDFKHQDIIKNFLENERAMYFLKMHNYL